MNTENPLNESERQHYEKTIGKLQQASSLEKLLLWVIAIIAAIGLAITYQAYKNAQNEAAIAQQRNEALIQEVKQSTEEVNRHLDCIVVFFTHPNRAQLTIKDIDNCTIQNGEVIITPLRAPEQPEDDSTPQIIVVPTPQKPEEEPRRQPEPPVQVPQPPTERPPREVLGIPVCVPLTDVCVR